jgi:hypothetical protein
VFGFFAVTPILSGCPQVVPVFCYREFIAIEIVVYSDEGSPAAICHLFALR